MGEGWWKSEEKYQMGNKRNDSGLCSELHFRCTLGVKNVTILGAKENEWEVSLNNYVRNSS